MQTFTVIDIKNDGTTSPRVENETDILLVQDGTVSVGMLCYEEDYADVYIEHPDNEAELNPEAMQLVKDNCPEHLKTKASVVLICPEELAQKMVW